MKQLQITRPGEAAWADAPRPTAAAGEALVRVEAVTTCPQWDLHIMHGEPMFPGMALPYPYYPGQPGHEMVGVVEEIRAPMSSLRPGDRVAVWRDSGPARTGAYGEFVALPAENLLPVSPDLPAESIASLELAMCVQVSFDQVEEAHSIHGATVGITGLGPAGLIATQIAKAMGARKVVAYDPVRARCEMALSLGADEAIDPASDTRSGTFLDVSLDMTGLPKAIHFLVERSWRAVAMFGVVREDVTFPPSKWYGGFSLIGYGAHNLGSAKRALTWIELDKLHLAPLVTHRMAFDEYARGVKLLESKEAIKILFDPQLPSKG